MPQQLLAASQMVGENQRRMSFSYTNSHIFHNEVHQNCNRETRGHVRAMISNIYTGIPGTYLSHSVQFTMCVNLQHINIIKPQMTATYLNSHTIKVNPLIPELSIQYSLHNTWNLNGHPFLHMFLADEFRCMKTKSFFQHYMLNNKKHPLKNK